MENFRDTLSMCDLHDIGPYTWDNGWSGNANVRVRLDRAVANTAWRDLFTDAKVCHLISSRSDHCSVLVEVKKDAWDRQSHRVFRYETVWERVDTFTEEIKKVWCSSADRQNLSGVLGIVRNMQKALRH
jgi:hypothetical protein